MGSIMKGKLHDVIVIGAGPAGATTARHCALKGLDTLVVEKKEFPRYKPCGGAVTQWALSNLDFELPLDMVEREWSGGRVFYKDLFAEANKPFRVGVLVSRSTFDDFLLGKAKEAGAKALLATRARDYSVRPDRVEVSSDKGLLRGRYLVIAEGAMGLLAERIRGPYSQRGTSVTVVTEIESSEEEIENRTQGKIHAYFGVAHRGYGWIFPHDRYFSMGIGGLRGRIANPINLMKDFLVGHGFDSRYKLRSHFLPIGGIRRKIADHRVLLVGDAAGFVDAFVGEGIGYAIMSGKLAAETICESLPRADTAGKDLGAFQEKCDAHFGARLRQSFYLDTVLHSLPGVFLRILASRPEVVDTLLNVAVWKMTYREFLLWFLPRIPHFLLG